MKKIILFIILISSCILLSACKTEKVTTSSSRLASPESLLNNKVYTDFFVMEDTLYANAKDLDWVKEIPVEKGNLIGHIKRSSITKGFKNFDATRLPVNTKIYLSDSSHQIVYVEDNGQLIPYLKIVEG